MQQATFGTTSVAAALELERSFSKILALVDVVDDEIGDQIFELSSRYQKRIIELDCDSETAAMVKLRLVKKFISAGPRSDHADELMIDQVVSFLTRGCG